jgi:hypothetical protein
MQIVNVDDLKEGMIVGEDVKDKNGQLLLPAGLTLTPKHLEVIKGWGISNVSVDSGDKLEEVPLDPLVIARAEKELSPIFRYADRNHPAMNELFNQCVNRRARQLTSGV